MASYPNIQNVFFNTIQPIITVSKNHLTDNFMKENSSNDCVLNVKNVEISDESGQILSGCQIYARAESKGKKLKKN